MQGRMREAGVDNDKGMVNYAEGVWNLGGRVTLGSLRDGIFVHVAVAVLLMVAVGVVVLMIMVGVLCIGAMEVGCS